MSVTDCLQFNHSTVCLSCHIQHSSCSFNQQDSKFWIWMVKCYFTGRFGGPRRWICIYYVWNHPLCVGVRVKRPQNNLDLVDLSSHSQSSRQYFFDNPRRYDSDDDLSRADMSRSINSYQPSTGPGTPTRSTPRGTPRLYGSIHSAAGSYTNKFGGFNSSPAAATND